ncbi:uncharacterized protein V1518DRAFT_373387 [Limtongia smithiae]|uniref:uncharacterized protein n=1 Tax=Limtongia smithiae TaxID=1125753 RepID=UPI0034CE5359
MTFKTRSDDDDDDDDLSTLKPRRHVPPPSSEFLDGTLFKAVTPKKSPQAVISSGSKRQQQQPLRIDDDFENDFEIPTSLTKMELKSISNPRASQTQASDTDSESLWGDESSDRFASSRRTDSSNRSSLMSTFSPSSSITYESEDDGFGLQIPDGPLNFQELLDAKMKSLGYSSPHPDEPHENDNFLDGLEIDDDENAVFNTEKLAACRNIRLKNSPLQPRTTPPKKTNTAVPQTTFASRIPRPVSQGALGITTILSQQQSKPGLDATPAASGTRLDRRLSHKSSMVSIKSSQPSSQRYGSLLTKKSMPSLRGAALDSASDRPMLPDLAVPFLSAQNWNTGSPGLKTMASSNNIRRMASRGSLLATSQKPPSTPSQTSASQYLSRKASISGLPSTVSREPSETVVTTTTSSTLLQIVSTPRHGVDTQHVPPSLTRRESGASAVQKSVKRRLFMDNSSTGLDQIEDLVVNPATERSMLARPVSSGNDPAQPGYEYRSKSGALANAGTMPSKSSRKKTQHRPHLIRPMGNDIANTVRTEKGMRYNPETFKWEGNESATLEFDAIASLTPPRPSLITNQQSTKGVQVVGGMVFDPVRMCWFKASDVINADAGAVEDEDEDEEDPFAGFEDFGDDDAFPSSSGGAGGFNTAARTSGNARSDAGNVYGEFVVGEEFDVGPAFVRKQMEEEDRWRRKVQGWMPREITPGGATRVSSTSSSASSASSTSSGSGWDRAGAREYLYEIRLLIMGGG